jgi:hypothetical protein
MASARELFDSLCIKFADLLNNDIECEHCKRGTMTAAELNVVRQFLKDNDTHFVEPNEATQQFFGAVPEFCPEDFK